jgi:hypothetical protein
MGHPVLASGQLHPIAYALASDQGMTIFDELASMGVSIYHPIDDEPASDQSMTIFDELASMGE